MEKIKRVRSYLEVLKSGSFKDTTGGATFYVHASDGSIWIGKTIQEAKNNASQHEKDLKLQKTKWGTAMGAPVILAEKG